MTVDESDGGRLRLAATNGVLHRVGDQGDDPGEVEGLSGHGLGVRRRQIDRAGEAPTSTGRSAGLRRVTTSSSNRDVRTPLTSPSSFADLRQAVGDGILVETHHVEFKAGLGTGSPPVNSGAAKDMASLSVDGGRLYYGVAESNGHASVEPIPTAGLRERLDQIARTLCDPPLQVFTSVHEDPTSESRGVVVVEVPPSADGPHMVDGRYHGRSDTTTYRLSDMEVNRLHAARAARAVSADDVIDAEIHDDPMTPEWPGPGRLYAVARPLASRSDLLTDHLFTPAFTELLRNTSRVDIAGSAPTWDYLDRSATPRADGVGFGCYETVGRRYQPNRSDRGPKTAMIDLEVHDDGTVRLWATGLADTVHNFIAGVDVKAVDEATAATLVRNLIEAVANIAKLSDYGGRWSVVVGLVGIRDHIAARIARGPGSMTRYTADRYVQARSLVSTEAIDQPDRVVDALMFRLRRGLGVSDY